MMMKQAFVIYKVSETIMN